MFRPCRGDCPIERRQRLFDIHAASYHDTVVHTLGRPLPGHAGAILAKQALYTGKGHSNQLIGAQFAGLQYNDDQNVQFIPAATLRAAGYDTDVTAGLPGYTTVDLLASRAFGDRFQLFAGAQNLTNKVFFVQTNPSTVGAPRMVNFGIRVRLAAK